MERPLPPQDSLRERKQRRARQAIIEAAHALFEERGFDRVTVTDIAERAEVGRATFFRYFGDKREVVFSADPRGEAELLEAAERIPADAPIGDSLPAALAYLRRAVSLLVEGLVQDPDAYLAHERLVARNPELLDRSVAKQRRYVDLMVGLLGERGADRGTSVLAAEIGLACFYAGRAETGDDPRRLPGCVDAAFARLL
ncbi:TetR/AcrR family transcriptional regulator [Nocardiopsis synnemataformans]|uniref:TetR/AcrR family transcriptional regulator n=1 Tax=Nocardiopsis synnemataformans TaxID=61305 RepID=UPI003EB87326